MDSVEAFAAEVKLFSSWLLDGSDEGPAAARSALTWLLRLYSAALELPYESNSAPEREADIPQLGREEWQQVRTAAKRLPLDLYAEVFDPTVVPGEEPVIASVSDDLADVYRDLVAGLRLHEAGHHTAAVWEWGFSLQSHWGAHATGAIRALHCWLATNAFEEPSRER